MSEMPQPNDRLKKAVRSAPVPDYLEARIRAHVRDAKPGRFRTLLILPATAAAVVLIGLFTAYQVGHFRLTRESRESYIAAVSYKVTALMGVGLGDHIHCSVFRKYPKNPPKLEELITQMDPQYSGLIPIVRKHVPEQYQMRLAHECTFHNRKFVHVSLMDGSNLLSLVITRKNGGESFNSAGLPPALAQSGIPIYQSGVQRFQITSFETRDYLVYFISDLSRNENTGMMLAMSTEVREFLTHLES